MTEAFIIAGVVIGAVVIMFLLDQIVGRAQHILEIGAVLAFALSFWGIADHPVTSAALLGWAMLAMFSKARKQ